MFSASVATITDLTHDVRLMELALRTPPAIAFAAGQFITFSVPTGRVPATVARAYSIASPPSRTTSIDLLFNLVPGGPGSGFLFARRPGDIVEFRPPAGSFVLRPDPARHLLFVATGTGIAPLRSMIRAALPQGRRCTLFWGLRSERDLYFQEEWRALARAHPAFSFTTTLSRPASAWPGPVGRVQRLVDEHVASVEDVAVYICGNSAMIESVTAQIRARGDCPIYYEQYYLDREG